MNILGPRVRIRPTRREDLPFLQTLWSDEMVMRHQGFPHGVQVTEDGMRQWWNMTPQAQQPLPQPAAPISPHCLIELQDGTPIGELTYSLDAHQRARIGLKLASAYWGRGLGTEALTGALRELFATSTVTKVVVEPTPDNIPAQKLFTRCGFHPAPTNNHPNRWECERADFANRG